jgi:hypothetical protein
MKRLSSPIKKHFRFFVTAVFICCGMLSLSANPNEIKTLPKDSSVIQPKEPSESAKQNYYNDDYWKYKEEKSAANAEPDAFDRLWTNFWEKIWGSVSRKNESSFNPWTILALLILITLIVLIVLRLTNTGVSTLFSGKRKTQEQTDATLEDVDIHSIDYDEEIRQAISKNDYRLAVRLWFLRTLKSFSDKELVHWKIDKTNSDYYYELSGTNFQQEFGDVSKVYDYIWYGEFPVDEAAYKTAEDKFRGLNNKLK